MTLDTVIQWRLGGLLPYTALGLVLYGVRHVTQRPAGRTHRLSGGWLRSPWFYPASSIIFSGVACLGWMPLAWTIPPPVRIWLLAFG